MQRTMGICDGASYGAVSRGSLQFALRVNRMATGRAACVSEYPGAQQHACLNAQLVLASRGTAAC